MTQISRRTVLGAAGLGAITALVGCTTSVEQESPTTARTPEGTPDMTPRQEPSPAGSRTLLVYFSRTGENYWEGGRRDLEIGNTEIVAQLIQDRIDCDVFEILAADPYPEAYDPTVARNVREQNADVRPAIDGELPDLSRYDTVLLGSPVWNVRAPMIMSTFVEAVDLTGKRVLPFVTYAVSGMAGIDQDYRDALPGSDLADGLAVRGEDAASAADAVDAWLRANALQQAVSRSREEGPAIPMHDPRPAGVMAGAHHHRSISQGAPPMNENQSTGRVAVITGASSGIGAATARALAATGYRVALLARRTDRIDTLAKELGGAAIAIPADVTDRGSLLVAAQRVQDELGRADVLVNNAGVMLLGPFSSEQHEDYRAMIEANLLGSITATEVFLDQLKSGTGGDIVNISSVAGRTARAGNGVYAATKWGINGWSESLRQELLPDVRVTLIEPGVVDTELPTHITHEATREAVQKGYDTAAVRPEEIAEVIAFVLSRPRHLAINEVLLRPSDQLG